MTPLPAYMGELAYMVAQLHNLMVLLNPKFCESLNHIAKTFSHSGFPSLTRGQSLSLQEGFSLTSGAVGQGHNIAVTYLSLEKYVWPKKYPCFQRSEIRILKVRSVLSFLSTKAQKASPEQPLQILGCC